MLRYRERIQIHFLLPISPQPSTTRTLHSQVVYTISIYQNPADHGNQPKIPHFLNFFKQILLRHSKTSMFHLLLRIGSNTEEPRTHLSHKTLKTAGNRITTNDKHLRPLSQLYRNKTSPAPPSYPPKTQHPPVTYISRFPSSSTRKPNPPLAASTNASTTVDIKT